MRGDNAGLEYSLALSITFGKIKRGEGIKVKTVLKSRLI